MGILVGKLGWDLYTARHYLLSNQAKEFIEARFARARHLCPTETDIMPCVLRSSHRIRDCSGSGRLLVMGQNHGQLIAANKVVCFVESIF